MSLTSDFANNIRLTTMESSTQGQKAQTADVTPLILLITAVTGNLLAIHIMLRAKREERSKMVFIFLLTLAVLNLILQLATGPITVRANTRKLQWHWNDSLCSFHGFALTFYDLVVPMIVLLTSIERVIALKFSLFYVRNASTTTAIVAIIGVCTFCAFICAMPFMGFGSYAVQQTGTWCFFEFHSKIPALQGYASMYAVLNIIALLAVIGCNSIVTVTLIKLRQKKRSIDAISLASELSTVTRQRRHVDIETRVIAFLVAITILFCVCWFPFSISLLIHQVVSDDYSDPAHFSARLISIYQALDPWLYIILRPNIWCSCSCPEGPSTTIGDGGESSPSDLY